MATVQLSLTVSNTETLAFWDSFWQDSQQEGGSDGKETTTKTLFCFIPLSIYICIISLLFVPASKGCQEDSVPQLGVSTFPEPFLVSSLLHYVFVLPSFPKYFKAFYHCTDLIHSDFAFMQSSRAGTRVRQGRHSSDVTLQGTPKTSVTKISNNLMQYIFKVCFQLNLFSFEIIAVSPAVVKNNIEKFPYTLLNFPQW